MNPFTTTLPAADAFGADTKYIAVNATTGEINAPVSAIQITHPKFGLAIRGDWQWALMDPSMAKLLLAWQPAQGATGDSEVVRLRRIAEKAIASLKAQSMNDHHYADLRLVAANDLQAELGDNK